MRFTVITTTINVPSVLEVYAGLHDDVSIVVAGDRKTPHDDVRRAFADYDRFSYLSPDDQLSRHYKCSDLIGWNTIQRRNIALLEAIRQQPDVVVTIDDDNFPVNNSYFRDVEDIFGQPFSGLAGQTHEGFFDIGQIFDPPFFHRGFPYDVREQKSELSLTPVHNIPVGVAEGLWLGDPDIDAVTRLVNRPLVKQVSDIARSGVIARPGSWTVFNTQNTAFLAELAPLMMVWPGVGRYDDIWASYAAQRVMRDTDWAIHFGAPLVWQERNPQNIVKNLRDEIYGMELTPRFLHDLDQMELSGSSHLERLKSLFANLRPLGYVPNQTLDVGDAWCEDVYDILSSL